MDEVKLLSVERMMNEIRSVIVRYTDAGQVSERTSLKALLNEADGWEMRLAWIDARDEHLAEEEFLHEGEEE